MDTKRRVLMEACVGFFNSMNLCYKQYDKEMRQLRMRFYNRLENKLRANTRIHQMRLMHIIELMHMQETDKPRKQTKKKRFRAIWKKDRSPDWWNAIHLNHNDHLWISKFRIDEETFQYLCETLSDQLKPKPNSFREAVPPSIKIGAALYKLATNEPYAAIGKKFGIHGISAQKALFQFCEACTNTLLAEYISMPEGEEVFDVMKQFEDKVALPQVLGVMDATRISISYKAAGMMRHMKENGSNNVILQAIIDPNCLFRDITFIENTDNFPNYYSDIREVMLTMPQKDVNGVPVPAYLISRRTDAPQWWLMKPYAVVDTCEEELFNDFLSKSSAVADKTFKKLKGRWQILQDSIYINVGFVPKVLTTCCILHNILETRGLPFDPSLGAKLRHDELSYTEPMDENVETCATGDELRDHLKNYISSQFN